MSIARDTITGAAHWASYFINGDASGLTPSDKSSADAWLERHHVEAVLTDVSDSERFTRQYQLYVPDADCSGGGVVDYVCAVKLRHGVPDSFFKV